MANALANASCERCRGGFAPAEKIVNSNGELYHEQCFVCAQCFQQFPEGLFYEVGMGELWGRGSDAGGLEGGLGSDTGWRGRGERAWAVMLGWGSWAVMLCWWGLGSVGGGWAVMVGGGDREGGLANDARSWWGLGSNGGW